MKKILAAGIASCLLAAVIAGIGIYKYQGRQRTVEPEEKQEGWQRADPAEFEAEEILWFDLMSHNEDVEKIEDISLWMCPGEEEADINGEKYALNEEQCNELRELILEYSRTVKEQEYEYWPHTDEYPDMLTLFRFDMRGEEKMYKTSGALCYPDGWEEFVEELKEIIF